MNYGIVFDDEPEIANHDHCCRCGLWTESSPVGTGHVPTGFNGAPEAIRKIVLCLDCISTMRATPHVFWYSGWPHHRRS